MLGRVAVIGPHIVDVLGRPVTEIPAGQGSAVLDEIRVTVAGTGGGAAVDLAKLGCEVTSCGAVGDDVLGQLLLTQLRAQGVDTSGLVVRPGGITSATILPIRPNGERPALHVPGATPSMTPEDLDAETLLAADAVLLGGPETMPNLLSPSGIAVLADVHAAGTPIFVDLLYPTHPDLLATLKPLLPLVSWFLPNDEQLCGLAGRGDVEESARLLLSHGVGAVAATVGAQGALLVRPDADTVAIPALPTTVVDTTGCGDSFNAGMITGLLLGCDPEDAALLGCACGALVASGLGSDAGIVDLRGVLDTVAHGHPDAAARIRARVTANATSRRSS